MYFVNISIALFKVFIKKKYICCKWLCDINIKNSFVGITLPNFPVTPFIAERIELALF
jgi:uncharacterized membrane protein YbaN (DUF454 family)